MSDHLRLLMAPGAPPAKRLLLAKYLLQSTGWPWDDAVEALHKATGTLTRRHGAAVHDEEGHILSTPALDALWQPLVAWAQQWPLALAQQLQWLIDGHEDDLEKARGLPWHFPWLAHQWTVFRDRMAGLSQEVLRWLTTREPVSADVLERLHVSAVVQDVFGEATRQGIFNQMTAATTLPALTATEQAAITYARQHAGARLRPVFTGLEARMEARLLEVERQRVQEAVGAALRLRQTPVQLASVLGDVTGQWQRDWQRVARTELQDAYNQGAVTAMIARHPSNRRHGKPVEPPTVPDGLRVYRIPSVSACQVCLRLWLRDDHSPRLYFLRDLLAHGSNEGRRAEDWLPVVGAVHPNCTCSAPLEYTGMSEITFERMREERHYVR